MLLNLANVSKPQYLDLVVVGLGNSDKVGVGSRLMWMDQSNSGLVPRRLGFESFFCTSLTYYFLFFKFRRHIHRQYVVCLDQVQIASLATDPWVLIASALKVIEDKKYF